MQINGERGDLFGMKADLVVIPFVSDNFDAGKAADRLPEPLRKTFVRLVKSADFKAEAGQTVLMHSVGDATYGHVLVVGIGSSAGFVLETARDTAGVVVATARRLGAKTVALALPGEDIDDVDVKTVAEATVIGALLADYAFDAFKKSNTDKKLKEFTIVLKNGRDVLKARKGVERGMTIAGGVNIARDLVNMPAHAMTPDALAQTAQRIAKSAGKNMKVKILDREQCEKLGMNAYLAVAQGAENPPKFIHLTYKPDRATKKKVAIVGKGVTFDSGGLSIKSADAMMTMKCDMAGAAAVLGIFACLAQLSLKVEVHGIIAATENMPSGKAMRPGDVVKASNGKTIEILNTDAEGRLTLADALTYAVKLEPDAIVDMATLTGAAVVALGEEIASLMTNSSELGQKVLSSAKVAGEKLWEMPLEKRYRPLIESEIADLRNIPMSRYGGSLTAGLFLQEFVDKTPWVHMDIAGPAYAERPLSSYLGRGGSGYGVRTLVDYLQQL